MPGISPKPLRFSKTDASGIHNVRGFTGRPRALPERKPVPVDKQWDLFRRLEDLVDAGEIAMPRQVIREVVEVAHPDAPGVWARGMQRRLQHPLDVDYDYVREVMRIAPNLVEANQQKDVVDPYVVALALQLCAAGEQVEIVTDDVNDHLPIKIALATACEIRPRPPWRQRHPATVASFRTLHALSSCLLSEVADTVVEERGARQSVFLCNATGRHP